MDVVWNEGVWEHPRPLLARGSLAQPSWAHGPYCRTSQVQMKEDIRTEKTESYGSPVGTRVRLIHRRHTWCGCSHASESRAGMKRDGPPEGHEEGRSTRRPT